MSATKINATRRCLECNDSGCDHEERGYCGCEDVDPLEDVKASIEFEVEQEAAFLALKSRPLPREDRIVDAHRLLNEISWAKTYLGQGETAAVRLCLETIEKALLESRTTGKTSGGA